MAAVSAVTWVPVVEALPDDDCTVLVALADGEVWTGFRDGGAWRYVSADPIEVEVRQWAHFPGPPNGEVSGRQSAPGPQDWYGQWRETQAENTALRELLREWYALFAPVRRENTEGAQLLDRTQLALTTKFRYVGPNVKGNRPAAGLPDDGPVDRQVGPHTGEQDA